MGAAVIGASVGEMDGTSVVGSADGFDVGSELGR